MDFAFDFASDFGNDDPLRHQNLGDDSQGSSVYMSGYPRKRRKDPLLDSVERYLTQIRAQLNSTYR